MAIEMGYGHIWQESDVVIIFGFSKGDESGGMHAHGIVRGMIARGRTEQGFVGEANQVVVLKTVDPVRFKRVILFGLGDAERVDRQRLIVAATRAVQECNKLNLESAVFVVPPLPDNNNDQDFWGLKSLIRGVFAATRDGSRNLKRVGFFDLELFFVDIEKKGLLIPQIIKEMAEKVERDCFCEPEG